MDANRAAVNLADKIGEIIFAPTGNGDSLAKAKAILIGFQKDKIDRSLFTDNANAYFDKQCLHDLATSLASLGAPTDFELVSEGLRGGMTARRYRAKFQKKTLEVSTYSMPDGKLEAIHCLRGVTSTASSAGSGRSRNSHHRGHRDRRNIFGRGRTRPPLQCSVTSVRSAIKKNCSGLAQLVLRSKGRMFNLLANPSCGCMVTLTKQRRSIVQVRPFSHTKPHP